MSVTGGRGRNECASYARGSTQEIETPYDGHGRDGGSSRIQADTKCRSFHMSKTIKRVKHETSLRGAMLHAHNADDVFFKVQCRADVSALPTRRTAVEMALLHVLIAMACKEKTIATGPLRSKMKI